MLKNKILLITVFAPLVFANSANAADLIKFDDFGLRAGTLGVGAEAGIKTAPFVTLRGVGQAADIKRGFSTGEYNAKGTLKLSSLGLQADLHMPLSPFYITGGIFANGNKIDADIKPSNGTYKINGNYYSSALIGNLKTNVDFDKTALYAGLGTRFSLFHVAAALEAGIYSQGKPKVKVTPETSGIVSQSDIDAQVRKYQADLDKLRYWPAVTLSAKYKF